MDKKLGFLARKLDDRRYYKQTGINRADNRKVIRDLRVGNIDRVRDNLLNQKYKGLTTETAHILCSKDLSNEVVKSLNSFVDSSHISIAGHLFSIYEGELVRQNFDSFYDLDHNKFAILQLNQGLYLGVSADLSWLRELNPEIAFALIRNRNSYGVTRYPGSFINLSHNTIALAVIKTEDIFDLARNLEHLRDLGAEALIALVNADCINQVVNNLGSFNCLENSTMFAGTPDEVKERLKNHVSNGRLGHDDLVDKAVPAVQSVQSGLPDHTSGIEGVGIVLK